jgi:hypothetical protein
VADPLDPDAGAVGTLPTFEAQPVLVAPTTAAHINNVTAGIIPVACWRMDDLRFDFDSSFIRPEAAKELRKLQQLVTEHPGAPASVFGHADPVGNDDYNKQLSGRRAVAVYALLIRDADRWEKLYNDANDHWGVRSIQVMLKTVGHDSGPPDGVMGDHTRRALREFQQTHGLPATGTADAPTRKKLFLAYMDAICVDNVPFKLDKTEFLAQGTGADSKGDCQGCSEFNPVLVFSQSEDQAFRDQAKKTERNAENAPNRRVVVLLFRPGSRVNPVRWPCPSAQGGVAGCKKRFWSDGEQRRNPQALRRKFEETKNTFACRFYHRLTVSSPCESVVPPAATATLEIILDNDDNHAVDASEPVATFVRIGLWDHAFDASTGNLLNDATEVKNYVGSDSTGREARRFYFRVRDPAAPGPVMTVNWRTALAAGGDDDAPASQAITLTATATASVFTSRAVFLTRDTFDVTQATNSGLPAGNPDTGQRALGASNHRTRKVTVDDRHRLDSTLVAEYTPAAGGAKVTASVPLFKRSPDERLKIKLHLVNVRAAAGGAGVLTAARKQTAVQALQTTYAPCGIVLEIDEIVLDPPASCIGWPTRYPTSLIAIDPAVESAGFPSGNLVPSASQTDIINAVRALPAFDAQDIYLVYVDRIFSNPVPPPPGGPPGAALAMGPGGIAFPDSFTAAGSIARGFVFIGVNTVNQLADPHEMTHVTTNLRNSAGGHFHLGATVGAGPGPIDGRNLMQRFVLISNGNVSDSKRLWDQDFTNNNLNPATIPAQIKAIRGSRFVRPL